MPSQPAVTRFEDIPVIGALPPRQIAAKLRRMGDPATAEEFLAHTQGRGEKAQLFGFGPLPAWKHTNHQHGYIANPIEMSSRMLRKTEQSRLAIDDSDEFAIFPYCPQAREMLNRSNSVASSSLIQT